jgi:3'(2'), 5'-bisphosphate nucleotidase
MTSPGTFADDARLARSLAIDAGNLLLALRRDQRLHGEALGKAGDAQANALILGQLRAARPDDAILSEESVDDIGRLAARRVWIIDPLDGTREFAERRDDWAVHVGLAVDGVPMAGAVALPAFGRCHDSLNPPALHAEARPLRLLVSRTRPPTIALRAAPLLGATLLPMGSAGAKVMAVLNGEAELYLHAGGQSEWDNCAPFAVALAAGLHCSRLDGRAVAYNQPQPLVPDLLVCHKARADAVLALLASLAG